MAEYYIEEDEEELTDIKFSKDIVLRILKIAWIYKGYFLGMVICTLIFAFSDSLYGLIVKQIIDLGIIDENYDALITYIIVYIIRRITMALMAFGFIYCAGSLSRLTIYSLRKQLFENIQNLSFSYFDKKPVGWLLARLISDTERVSMFVTWNLHDFLWTISTISAAIIYMTIINWILALIIIAMIPIVLFIAVKFQTRIKAQYRRARTINSRITGYYNENITGVKIVKGLVREKKNLGKFKTLTKSMYDSSYGAVKLSSIFVPLVQVLSAIAFGIVIWYGGEQFKLGTFTIGSLQAFIAYIGIIIEPINVLASVYAEMQQGIASAEKIFAVVDTESEIQNSPNATVLDKIDGDISYQNVSFYYNENNPVLKDFSLKVNSGETIALVGPTGGGKTTIANLVCRFYEPKKGSILINGKDYKDFTQESLQARIGVVLQTPHLFSGSILDNIRYGKLDATDEEVYEAAKLAHADDFIQKLENKYEGEVGEAGALLSQGQRQLVSLARAILANPDLVIMDEATSSIDSITEELIQKGMKVLLSNCTGFLIAHRLSTIRNADRILYIDKGRIVEQGSHNELLLKKGLYYQLYTGQFRKEKGKMIFDPK